MKYTCPKCKQEEDFKRFHPNFIDIDQHKTVVIVRGYCDNCGAELEMGIILAEINEVVLSEDNKD